MRPSVDPIDGAPDSTRSDSTYPNIDTGEFRIRRSRARLWIGFGVALAAITTSLILYSRHNAVGGSDTPSELTPTAPPADIVRAEETLADQERKRCLELEKQVLAEPKSPGTPTLDERRVELLLRTKLEPVIFVQPPQFDQDVPKSSQRLRHTFQTTNYPSTLLKTLTPAFRIRPEAGRQMLLRNGYLYADEPEQAFALVYHVRAEHLFDAEQIWIQRGEQTLHAERTKLGKYRYRDGALEGKEVSLVLFDRIGTGSVPPPLHRDVRSLQYRLNFDRLEPVHVTPTHMVANLKYGGLTIPTVLAAEGARLNLECEVVPRGASKDLALYRDRGKRQLTVVQALRGAMREQIEEELPFDEPYREWGQQDGVLRYKWRDAYFSGKKRFDLNGDTYYVYDPAGHPKLPQVCVDFLTDTLERASGTWWSPVGEKPRRIVGGLNFDTLNNPVLRRASAFIEYTHEHSEKFDVYDVPPEKLVPFWRRQEFMDYLVANVDRLVPGDIVIIRGQTNFEKKGERPIMHYHSFFIYERDPVTGVPLAIVGNAGVPSLRVWNTEMRRTPRRSIWHRIRPQLHWLETVIQPGADRPDTGPSTEPAPLALGRD